MRKYKELLGAQIIAFDGRPAVDVLNAMQLYMNADHWNRMKIKVSAPYRIRNLKMLHALGFIENIDRVTCTIHDLNGSTRVVVVEAETTQPDIWNTLPAPQS
jgi:hypothetical protein